MSAEEIESEHKHFLFWKEGQKPKLVSLKSIMPLSVMAMFGEASGYSVRVADVHVDVEGVKDLLPILKG